MEKKAIRIERKGPKETTYQGFSTSVSWTTINAPREIHQVLQKNNKIYQHIGSILFVVLIYLDR